MRKWWISWYATPDMGAFELRTPWWVTGTRLEDEAKTVCAAVTALDVIGAKEVILKAYDTRPDDVDWRFVTEEEEDWSPFNARFRKAEWMRWDV